MRCLREKYPNLEYRDIIMNDETFESLLREQMKVLNDIGLLKCCVAPMWLLSFNPFIEFRIWNNSSSSDVLYIQASMSISPKYKSK